ncbi:MAG: hypothetical protein ACYSSO_06180 [Planctomycetota bacterium]|jgi:hypothetical protein
MEAEVVKKTSRIAMASMILMLLAMASVYCGKLFNKFSAREIAEICVFVSIFLSGAALILGITSIFVITIQRRQLKGYVFSIAAILLSAPIFFLIYPVTRGARFFHELRTAGYAAERLDDFNKALVEYANNHDGRLPDAERWCDILMEQDKNLTKESFRHPKADELRLKGDCNFAFNKNLSGKKLSEIADDVVLIFGADGDWNLNGGRELLKTRYRKDGCIAMLFANGKTYPYWFSKDAVRKEGSEETAWYYYEKARWEP